MLQPLKKTAYAPPGPVVLAILDGFGLSDHVEGNAIRSGFTPHLNRLMKLSLMTSLKAHGTAVGLPSDEDMGNSEVGHNAIGCGRVFAQGAKLVTEAIQTGALFRGRAWKEIVENALARQSTLHFMGLFSDGNVHSHLDHLKAMLEEAKKAGIKTVRLHILLDGRDVGETSALDYVVPFEQFLAGLNAGGAVDYRIASGGGRMAITMDRYNADWSMVQRGWDTHVRGKGPQFASAKEAIESHRKTRPGVIDQDLPAFVIAKDGKPIGPICDNDSVVFFNFRGDRAIEITKAFEDDHLDQIDRNPRPKVVYAGMMQYDGDLQLPKRFLVTPPAIDRTMGEFLAASGVTTYSISETQKYGHVTYFFNGNRSGKFDEKLETYVEVTSDIIPFEQRPWMKSAEITDTLCAAVASGNYRFLRVNYPNGDMVGHTGVFQAVQIAVESVDLALGRLVKAVEAAKGILIVSADHGNAEDMYERSKKTGKVTTDPDTGAPKMKTAHSLNPVPCLIYDSAKSGKIVLADRKGLGISSLAATVIKLLGYEPPADYDASVVDLA